MLLVETELRPSLIHGIGVFSLEFIPKGTPVWEYDLDCDYVIHKRHLDKFPIALITHLWDEGDYYFGSLDHVGYTNTSDTPNTTTLGSRVIAAKDIEVGEEITFDYNSDLYLNCIRDYKIVCT